ncbi:hypothetical protein JOE65_001985 [Arthrobacter roseus]|nr:hypothetical protein [Arthrobacter roseus]
MYLSSVSATGVGFLAATRDGHGLKRAAREAGISDDFTEDHHVPYRRTQTDIGRY